MKSNKLLPKFEKEVEKMRVKRDSYFDWAESIYAISRIIPNATDDSLRHKLTEVNKVWVRMVVTDDLCPQLRPYFDKYGQEAVYNAVSYLLEKNAWVSPVDDKGLKAKMPSNYDGLQDIDETVAMLNEEEEYRKGKNSKPAGTTEAAEPVGKATGTVAGNAGTTETGTTYGTGTVTAGTTDGTGKGTYGNADGTVAVEPVGKATETVAGNADGTIVDEQKGLPFDIEALKAHKMAYDDATTAYKELGDMLTRALELHTTFGTLAKQEELLAMFEQDNKRLEEELAEHKNMVHAMKRMKDEEADKWRAILRATNAEDAKREEQYKKDIASEKSTADTLRKELERERRLHKEDNDKAYHNRIAKENAEKTLVALKVEYDRTVADLAELRRVAKDASQIPAFKIIPMEELDTMYGMGVKMKSVLLPFMEKHGVRFLTDDERKRMKRQQR